MSLDSKEIALLAYKAGEEKKGWDITILDLQKISSITDYFLICNGNSRVHTQALSDFIEEELTNAGVPLTSREGYAEGKWILLDFNTVIVHIFQKEDRDFYNLERLWGDAQKIFYREA